MCTHGHICICMQILHTVCKICIRVQMWSYVQSLSLWRQYRLIIYPLQLFHDIILKFTDKRGQVRHIEQCRRLTNMEFSSLHQMQKTNTIPTYIYQKMIAFHCRTIKKPVKSIRFEPTEEKNLSFF